MHPCPGNWVAIGCPVVYYARLPNAISAGIKCRHLNAWAAGSITRPHARLPPDFIGMDDLTTEHSCGSHPIFSDMLFMCACTTLALADVRSTREDISLL